MAQFGTLTTLRTDKDAEAVAKRQEEMEARKVLNDVSQNSRRFADADKDGDQKLDYEEFVSMLPDVTRAKFSQADIRMWFDLADTDKSGELSISEFFMWTLSSASEKFGTDALMSVFSKYDPNSSGLVDMNEFQKACDDSGFGLVAHDIFRALDADGSGQISYKDLSTMCSQSAQRGNLGGDAQRMLTSLIWAWDTDTKEETKTVLETSFDVRGTTVAEVCKNLQERIAACGAPIVDIIKMFDVDATRTFQVDRMEFNSAMRNKFGFRGSNDLIDDVFTLLDTDGSGMVGFDELYEFVRGKRHSLDYRHKRVHGMTAAPPKNASYKLRDVAWDETALSIILKMAMDRCFVSPSDLITAWDKGKNGDLSEKEFMSNMCGVFANEQDLWKDEVEKVAQKMFQRMARKAGDSKVIETTLDVTELELWVRSLPDTPLLVQLKPGTPRHEDKQRRKKKEKAAAPVVEDVAVDEDAGVSFVNIPYVVVPRTDLTYIINGHARFWIDAKERVNTSTKLPPLSPRSARAQPITASLPRNPTQSWSPRRSRPDFVF